MYERCFYVDGSPLWLHCNTERANGKVGSKRRAINQRLIRLVVLFLFHIVLSFMEMKFRMILAVFYSSDGTNLAFGTECIRARFISNYRALRLSTQLYLKLLSHQEVLLPPS